MDARVPRPDSARDGAAGRDGGTAPPDPDGGIDAGYSSVIDAGARDGEVPELPRDAMAADAGEASDCAAQIARFVHEHACLHAQHGPFAEIMASARPASAPDVSRSHTAFALRWREGQEHGLARFNPSSSGLHVFYLGGVASLALTALPSERRVEAIWSESSGCAALPEAAVVELENSETYLLSLQSVSASSGLLVIEALEPLGPEAVLHACACTLAPLGAGCDADDGCCSGLCLDAQCAPPEAPLGCDGGLANGATCMLDGECCSGICLTGSCAASSTCRSSGPCSKDEECCLFCHDGDHCH